ncbi:hypothetical protein A3I50_03660 [Candidatus Roizmanbacteria bacterium RIFCSPLOWO2_02_FULL_37_9]|nr:MAG: hypothetical protein A3I50_03660 [Candidatus Roizmanbacteria bacterium RIFCSPLOWO2_02_FULL_37_9]
MSYESELLKRLFGMGIDCHSHQPHKDYVEPFSLDGPNPIYVTPSMKRNGEFDPSVYIRTILLLPFFKTYAALSQTGSSLVENSIFASIKPGEPQEQDFNEFIPTNQPNSLFEGDIKEGGFSLKTWISRRGGDKRLEHYHLYQRPPLMQEILSYRQKFEDHIGSDQTSQLFGNLSELFPSTFVTSTTGISLEVAGLGVFYLPPIGIGKKYFINGRIQGQSKPKADARWELNTQFPYRLKLSSNGGSFRFVAATVGFAENNVFFYPGYPPPAILKQHGITGKLIYVVPGIRFCSPTFRKIDEQIRAQIAQGLFQAENFKGIVRPTYEFINSLQN